jgi:type V secretory pathway adhesin AidA
VLERRTSRGARTVQQLANNIRSSLITGGTATGGTLVQVNNAGGHGDQTFANGILIVQAINGATTAPGAFALDAPAVAGTYEYFSFHQTLPAAKLATTSMR